MTLTKAQRKRLAVEARKLAMECVENGPKMANVWCGCAIGVSLARAGLLPADWTEQHRLGCRLERLLDPNGDAINGILSMATRERVFCKNPTAVVIPLLAWADALEEA